MGIVKNPKCNPSTRVLGSVYFRTDCEHLRLLVERVNCDLADFKIKPSLVENNKRNKI